MLTNIGFFPLNTQQDRSTLVESNGNDRNRSMSPFEMSNPPGRLMGISSFNRPSLNPSLSTPAE